MVNEVTLNAYCSSGIFKGGRKRKISGREVRQKKQKKKKKTAISRYYRRVHIHFWSHGCCAIAYRVSILQKGGRVLLFLFFLCRPRLRRGARCECTGVMKSVRAVHSSVSLSNCYFAICLGRENRLGIDEDISRCFLNCTKRRKGSLFLLSLGTEHRNCIFWGCTVVSHCKSSSWCL